MKLQSNEQIIKTFHHHPLPFFIQIIKTIGASLPFFFLLYLFTPSLSYNSIIIANLIIIGIFGIIILYLGLIYWLDKLIITNKRAVHVDWIVLSKRIEGEALLNDIQDIQTQEKGLLSALYIFDYGSIQIKTASSKTTITFTEAPDPEGIKAFLAKNIEACKPTATCDIDIAGTPALES
ncbi:hypothetical protein J7J83_01235 [bacterium]|nr:hypothetical protein [bacterium]